MEKKEKLYKVIEERLGKSGDEVTLESRFKDDLDADSLDVVELVMELEDAFDIEINDEDAEKMTTVGDALTYLEKHA